jgi:hypothetical protein
MRKSVSGFSTQSNSCRLRKLICISRSTLMESITFIKTSDISDVFKHDFGSRPTDYGATEAGLQFLDGEAVAPHPPPSGGTLSLRERVRALH